MWSPCIAVSDDTNRFLCRPYGISQQVATSAEVMQENSFDPSHSNYVHGSTFQKREDAMPMRAKLITKVPSRPRDSVQEPWYLSSRHCSPAAQPLELSTGAMRNSSWAPTKSLLRCQGP